MLIKALQRIKISNKIIQIIQLLLKSQKNTILIAFGSTPEYTIEDGIDQRDTIFPLL